MRKRNFVIGLLCIGVIIAIFLPLQKVFAFTETRTTNPQLNYLPIEEKDDFKIRYTHSIHKSDVMEYYRVTNDNKIQMLGMEYEDLAIGMPGYAEEGQTLTQRNGSYYLKFDVKKVLDSFTMYIGDLDIDLVFDYKNDEYDLKKDLQRGKSYLFEVKRVSLYEQWKGVRLK
ncbi:MAG: DUF1850 domain-containing protein [Lysinibacillus sp.]